MIRYIILFLCLTLLSNCQKDDNDIPSANYDVEANVVINGSQIIKINGNTYCEVIGGNVLRFSYSTGNQMYKYTVGQNFNSINDDYLYFNFIDTMNVEEPVSNTRMVKLLNSFPNEPTQLVPELSFLYEKEVYKTALVDGANGNLLKSNPNKKHELEFTVIPAGSCDIVPEVIVVDYTYQGYAYNTANTDSVFVDSSTFRIYLRGAP